MKCYNCDRNNHAVDNCFALHAEKRHFVDREKTLEAKVGALKEMFKNLASSAKSQTYHLPPGVRLVFPL